MATGLWGDAGVLSSSGVYFSVLPAVAIGVDGNAVAAWGQGTVDTAPNETRIAVSRYISASDSWTSAVTIDPADAGKSTAARVAVDGVGNAIVLWVNLGTSYYNWGYVWGSRYSAADAGWEAPTTMSVDAGYAETPRIGFDSAGNAVALWLLGTGGPWWVWSRHYNATSASWGPEVKVHVAKNGVGAYGAIDLAVTESGRAFATGMAYDDGGVYSAWASTCP